MKKKAILIVVLLALIAGGAYGIYAFQKEQKRLNMTENFFLAGDRELITVYDENKEEVTLTRGAEVAVKINKEVEWEGAQVKEALIGETLYYIPESVLVATREEAVINTQLYSMRPEVVYQNIGSPVILLSIRENTPLEMKITFAFGSTLWISLHIHSLKVVYSTWDSMPEDLTMDMAFSTRRVSLSLLS